MYVIKYYLEKYKIQMIVSLVFIIIVSISMLYFYFDKKNSEKIITISDKKESVELLSVDSNSISNDDLSTEIEKVKVDVKGMVLTPGVYELDLNSRVIDAINKAGGLIEGGNTSYINLSKKVTDEMVIIVYSNEEIESFKSGEKVIVYIEKECECKDNNDACISNKNDSEYTTETSKEDITSNLVSINNGTKEELMTLDGIGESKAQAIIDYREEHGNFLKLEDLMNVSGIGEKAYSKIKDNIKL